MCIMFFFEINVKLYLIFLVAPVGQALVPSLGDILSPINNLSLSSQKIKQHSREACLIFLLICLLIQILIKCIHV